jgi:hypothetical protein
MIEKKEPRGLRLHTAVPVIRVSPSAIEHPVTSTAWKATTIPSVSKSVVKE